MGFIICHGELRKYREEPGVTEVVIPDGVMIIREQAFSDCSSLTSVVIPDSVTSIGNGAFWHCKSLTAVIPKRLMPKFAGLRRIEKAYNYFKKRINVF